jgi:hypothetical protein
MVALKAYSRRYVLPRTANGALQRVIGFVRCRRLVQTSIAGPPYSWVFSGVRDAL